MSAIPTSSASYNPLALPAYNPLHSTNSANQVRPPQPAADIDKDPSRDSEAAAASKQDTDRRKGGTIDVYA